VDNIYAEPILSRYFSQLDLPNLVLLSPDVGNAKRARQYARRLNGELAIIDKRRVSGTQTTMNRVIGDVRGKTVLMMDDMISTAGTVALAAQVARNEGAARILVGATHPVLVGPALDRLAKADIDEVVVTNTVPVSQEKQVALPSLKILSVADLLGEAIHRIHNNESVSSLFLRD
jgi:ribose-phosphate pyrophosphokinase